MPCGFDSRLQVQDQPWEFRYDNGYPNVIRSPGDPHGEWRVWYNSAINGANCSVGTCVKF